MTGGELILRFLVEQGVTVGFGIPGAMNAHLYDALPSVGQFRHILVRHELGGTWMADGYARARNEVGVSFTVPGPGATHAASAVAGAYADCSRLLVISAQSESGLRGELRRDLFHGLDQQRLFAPITKWSSAVRTVGDIPETLAQAFHHLRRGRPGPVHVEIPADVLGDEAGRPTLPGFIRPAPAAPAPDTLDRAAAALRSARRPLILAGDGVLHHGGSEQLGRLAALLRAPVVTTVMGKGALSEAHPWSLGDSNSAAGAAAYAHHDLVLAAGARFVQLDTRWSWFFPPRRLVHLDADSREVGRLFPADAGIVADTKVALEGLADALEADPGNRSGWDEQIAALKDEHAGREGYPVVAAVRRGAPRETLAAFDVCVPGFHSRSDWLTYEPYSYFYPGVYVGMGFGLPAGVGAKLARPDRPVCTVSGDAGFQMTMAELATAVQHDVRLTVVVVNDGGLDSIRRFQDRELGGRRCEVELVNPDFVALAAAYGIPAERVETPEGLADAVCRATERGKLSLVELRTG